MTRRRLTATECVAHSSRAWIVVLALRIHKPGPRTGKSATLRSFVSVPLRTPVDTTTSGGESSCLTLGRVTATDLIALVDGVVFFLWALVFGNVVVVVVLVTVVVVVVVGASVEVVDTGFARCWVIACGVGGEEVVVNVKTNTTSSNGLDHIKRCALRSENGLLVMVLKRYRS
jgi:hypothetical protein